MADSCGHLAEGLAGTRKAYGIAPASAGAIGVLAATYTLLGRDAEAIRFARLGDAIGARNQGLIPLLESNAAWRAGRDVEAAELILPTLPASMRTGPSLEMIKRIFAAHGNPGLARAATEDLQYLSSRTVPEELGTQVRQQILIRYVALGNLDAAFDFASRSVDLYARSGSVGTTWGMLWSPEMRPFRRDPRFQAFAARLKMSDDWKQYGPPDECDLEGDELRCR